MILIYGTYGIYGICGIKIEKLQAASVWVAVNSCYNELNIPV